MEFMPKSQRRKKLSIFTKKITADIITHYGMQVSFVYRKQKLFELVIINLQWKTIIFDDVGTNIPALLIFCPRAQANVLRLVTEKKILQSLQALYRYTLI